MNETMLTDNGMSQPEQEGRPESGARGPLVQSDRTLSKWMKSEWFDDWVKLAKQPHEESPK